jgi:hypothetical protein
MERQASISSFFIHRIRNHVRHNVFKQDYKTSTSVIKTKGLSYADCLKLNLAGKAAPTKLTVSSTVSVTSVVSVESCMPIASTASITNVTALATSVIQSPVVSGAASAEIYNDSIYIDPHYNVW